MIWASNWPLNRPILPTAEWSRKWGVGRVLFQNRLLHLKISILWIPDVCFDLCHRVVESKSRSTARSWCRPHWALGQSRPFFDPCQAKPSVNVALWLPSSSGSRIVQSAMTTTLKMGSSSLSGNAINPDRFVLGSYLDTDGSNIPGAQPCCAN